MAWKDIDIELSKQHDGDVRVDIGIDAIINSITNIFKTLQGSRRMVPSFAMPSYNMLFEQIDDISLDALQDMLFGAISMWEDRIYVNFLKATADADNNRIDVNLEFRLKGDVEDRVFNVNETMVMRG